MHQLGQFVAALLLAYFVSRLTRRLPLSRNRTRKLLWAHAISFALLAAAIVAVRQPAGAIAAHSLPFLALAQTLWLVFDGLRAQTRSRKD